MFNPKFIRDRLAALEGVGDSLIWQGDAAAILAEVPELLDRIAALEEIGIKMRRKQILWNAKSRSEPKKLEEEFDLLLNDSGAVVDNRNG